MNSQTQKVESVQERDIDLLLLEELYADTVFLDWMTNKLNLPRQSTFKGAWRSISDYGLGETDILISYQSENGSIYILLENKLDASFQEEQHSRYIQRSTRYVDEGKCDIAVEVLVAPEGYCTRQSDFSKCITYEDISAWFNTAGDARSLFKSELLQIAIEKLRRGYSPANSEVVQQFWHTYWRLQNEMLPEFKMKEPKVVPVNSDWPILTVDALPNIKFYHKWKQGNVDATFYGLFEVQIKQLEEQCSEPFEVVRHTSGVSLRLRTAVVNRLESFEEQRKNIIEGLNCIKELRAYLKSIDL